jgi:tRNA(Ile)-lysidine synthase
MGGPGAASAPLLAAEFATLMAPFAPFEPAPRIAVAVSGGADSLCLALLADDWAKGQGGGAVVLTVDHRLRPEATAEARLLGRWLKARGIEHHILVWEGSRPLRAIQAAARAARYRLLERWCAEAGILHLLLAHHQDDQAETLLLRLASGSGLDGLAAMAGASDRPACRLLRPLLSVARVRLMATLEVMGQSWIEDPSNQDQSFARGRIRRVMPLLAEQGVTAERLAGAAARLGRTRAALEAETAALMVRAVMVHPGGFARIEPAQLGETAQELALRALGALLTTIGGADYPPRRQSLERLLHQLIGGLESGRTLGGCRILPRRAGILVCREAAAMAAPVPATPGVAVAWDGRFRLHLPSNAPEGLLLGALGPALPQGAGCRLPAAVRVTLPALRYDDGEVAAIPALGYASRRAEELRPALAGLLFRPLRPLSGAGFTVV